MLSFLVCCRFYPKERLFTMASLRLQWRLQGRVPNPSSRERCPSSCLSVLGWPPQCRFWPTVSYPVRRSWLRAEPSQLRSASETRCLNTACHREHHYIRGFIWYNEIWLSFLILSNKQQIVPDLCSTLQVLVQFSPPKAVPGEKSSLQLSAQPGSLCGLSAVDQSILILEPGKRLDVKKVTIVTCKNNTMTLYISSHSGRSVMWRFSKNVFSSFRSSFLRCVMTLLEVTTWYEGLCLMWCILNYSRYLNYYHNWTQRLIMMLKILKNVL